MAIKRNALFLTFYSHDTQTYASIIGKQILNLTKKTVIKCLYLEKSTVKRNEIEKELNCEIR